MVNGERLAVELSGPHQHQRDSVVTKAARTVVKATTIVERSDA